MWEWWEREKRQGYNQQPIIFFRQNKMFYRFSKFWIDSPIDSNQGEDFGSNKNTSEQKTSDPAKNDSILEVKI